jgi:hypothetical protein
VTKYIVDDVDQLTYAIPAGAINPVAVLINGSFLTNQDQYINGQYSVDLGGNTITLNSNVTLQVGDIIEIESNIINLIQQVDANTPFTSADFGAAVDICPNNCSVYIGAPNDGSILPSAGSVDRRVNQARIYGVITSTVANPSLTAGDTIRINNFEVAVPASPNNTVTGLATSINNYTINDVASGIPNVQASVSNGLLTISVVNVEAADEFNRLSVLPGVSGTAFSSLGFDVYAYTQTIVSPNPVVSAGFGSAVFIDTEADNLVVGAPRGNIYEPVTFDNGRTYFDDRSTVFSSTVVQSGAVYTFDYLPSATDSITVPGQFIFGQQIYDDNVKSLDQWGTAVDYTNGRLLVGSPGSDLEDRRATASYLRLTVSALQLAARGLADAATVGGRLGTCDGVQVGCRLGVAVGVRDGSMLGENVGTLLSASLGTAVGDSVGSDDGCSVGASEPTADGPNDGCRVL